MSLELDAVPTFTERIAAVDLALVGTISGPVRVEPAPGFEPPRIMGFFEVHAEEPLLGKPPGEVVLIRVMGDGSAKRPRWSTELTAGARMLLLLSRDVSPGLPENLHTPYFSSAFPIDDAGRVSFDVAILDPASRKALRPARGLVPLARVRQALAAAVRAREKRRRELDALIPRRLRGPYPEGREAPWDIDISTAPVGPFGAAPEEAELQPGRDAKPSRPPSRRSSSGSSRSQG